MKTPLNKSIAVFYEPEFFPEHNFWGKDSNIEKICEGFNLLDFQKLNDSSLKEVKTLILPYEQRFPLKIYEQIKRLLAKGGDIIVLGGAPFEKPCVFKDGAWKIDDPIQMGLWKEFFHSEWRNNLGLSFHNVVRKSLWRSEDFSLNVNDAFKEAFGDLNEEWNCEAFLGELRPLHTGRQANIMSTSAEKSSAPGIVDFVSIAEPLHSREINGRVLCAGFEANKSWSAEKHRSFLDSLLKSLEIDSSNKSPFGMHLSSTVMRCGGNLKMEIWKRGKKEPENASLEVLDSKGEILAEVPLEIFEKIDLPLKLNPGAYCLALKSGPGKDIKCAFSILEPDKGKLPNFKATYKNGYPVIEKDAEAIPAELYAFDPVDRHLDKIAAEFAEHKIKIIHFLHPLMLSWKGKDEYDWSSLDFMIERILQKAPDALVFPRILLQTPPWWDEANPDEVKVYRSGRNYVENKETATTGFHYGGQLPIYSKFNNGGLSPRIKQASYYSKSWRNDIADAMKDLAKHVGKKIWRNNFLGIFFGAGTCGEWGNFTENASQDWEDMSKPALKAFREWLTKKYPAPSTRLKNWEFLKDFTKDHVKLPESKYLLKTDFVHGLFSDPEKMNQNAQNITPAEIENALPPNFARRHVSRYGFLKDPQQSADSIEYFSWIRESFPELLIEISKGIRAAFPNKIIVGTFYGYLMQEYFVDLDGGASNLGFPIALASPDSPDLYVAPHYYNHRELVAGDANVKCPSGSVRLSNKIFLDENDQRTILSERKNYLHYGGRESDGLKEAVEMCKRNFVARLTKNVGLWWYDLFGHGWYDHPQIMKTIQKTFDIYKLVMENPNPKSFSDSDERINVIYGVDGYKYQCACSMFSPLNTHEHIQKHFNRNGFAWEAFLKEDIEKAPKAKAWLFLNTFNISQQETDWINKNLKRDGNILIWLYAPGIYRDGKMDLQYASELTGINLEWDVDSYLRDIKIEKNNPALLENAKGFITSWKDAEENSNIRKISPEIFANDPEAVAFGRNPENERTTFATRDFGDWKSVYIAAPIIPHQIMRTLLKWNGMKPTLDSPDSFYSNGDIIGISASSDGVKTISYPDDFEIDDLWNGGRLKSENQMVSLEMKKGETFIGRVIRQPGWPNFGMDVQH